MASWIQSVDGLNMKTPLILVTGLLTILHIEIGVFAVSHEAI